MLRPTTFAALTVALTGAATPSGASDATTTVEAVVRDFPRGDLPNGHPDFNTARDAEREGITFGMVEQLLGADGRPVYNPVRPVNRDGNDPLTTEANFNQWYQDLPGVNYSMPLELNLGPRSDDPTILTTEGYNDDLFRGGTEGGYFPVNDQGFGNQGHAQNYGFTTQIAIPFNYIAGGELNFSGDDDVWAFINGKLAIDLGGVHGATASQVILLDGRMFVETDKIPVGGIVNAVDAAYQSRLETDWARLGMPGSLPIQAGTHGWVDLGLALGDDSRADFSSDGLNVTVATAGPPPGNVRLVFDNGRSEVREWQGNGATYAGTETNNGNPVASIDLIAADGTTTTYSAVGRAGATCQLDFFHAERQWVKSNFLLETTLLSVGGNRTAFTGYD